MIPVVTFAFVSNDRCACSAEVGGAYFGKPQETVPARPVRAPRIALTKAQARKKRGQEPGQLRVFVLDTEQYREVESTLEVCASLSDHADRSYVSVPLTCPGPVSSGQPYATFTSEPIGSNSNAKTQ